MTASAHFTIPTLCVSDGRLFLDHYTLHAVCSAQRGRPLVPGFMPTSANNVLAFVELPGATPRDLNVEKEGTTSSLPRPENILHPRHYRSSLSLSLAGPSSARDSVKDTKTGRAHEQRHSLHPDRASTTPPATHLPRNCPLHPTPWKETESNRCPRGPSRKSSRPRG
jgi:hypothetical protein